MKRIIAIFSIIITALFMIITIEATDNSYYLKELGFHITITGDYSIITRDTPANDPLFSKFGTDKSTIVNNFKRNNIYLNAISNKGDKEIVVTMTESPLNDFSSCSDTVLNIIASRLTQEYINYGLNVSYYEIYQYLKAKYIKINYTNNDNTVCSIQYYTVYDGKAISLTLHSYEKSDSNYSVEDRLAIKYTVNSIKYDTILPRPIKGEDTNSFEYTDSETGVTFVMPKNWKQEAFIKDREFIDVKFASTKEDGCTIIYGSTDMWGKMSASDKNSYSRYEFNNFAFTKSDIAEMFNISTDDVYIVEYNGLPYFKCEGEYSVNVYGIEAVVPMTQLVYIENGWIYIFQFSGGGGHKLYSDFENMIRSVRYPAAVGSADKDFFNNMEYGWAIVVVVSLLTLVAIIFIAVLYCEKKNNANKIKNVSTQSCNELKNNTIRVVICKNCGYELPIDSIFCHKCGSKIEKEI